MSHIGRSQDATQELLAAALVIARSPTIRAWLLANDPMALQQLDTAVAAHHNTDPTAEPVHLVINDTDSSGTGYVVGFDSEEAYLKWQARLNRLTADAEQPFGFRGKWGLAHAILTPEQALALLCGQQEDALTIPESAWREHGDWPDPGDPATAHFQPSDRLSAMVTINGTAFFAEAYALVHDEQQAAGRQQAAVQDDDDLDLHHQAAHGDGPFQNTTIRGREYVVVLTPSC
jgi:hypothetical protein